jgi:hypothetical protein
MGNEVPNTISDKDMKKLKARANKANPNMFSKKAIEQRKHHNQQKYKAEQS